MKLVRGAGAPGEGACWMSAVHQYQTELGPHWSDHPECVSPIIRELCIQLNDRCESDEEREGLIGPHLFTPVGTNDPHLERRRIYRVADMACRVWAPRALRAAGLVSDADELEALEPVADVGSAEAAWSRCRSAAYAAHTAAIYASSAAAACIYDAAYAYAYDASASASAAIYAFSDAAIYAARVTASRSRARIELRDLILELCSWSDRPELDSTLVTRVRREACLAEVAQ